MGCRTNGLSDYWAVGPMGRPQISLLTGYIVTKFYRPTKRNLHAIGLRSIIFSYKQTSENQNPSVTWNYVGDWHRHNSASGKVLHLLKPVNLKRKSKSKHSISLVTHKRVYVYNWRHTIDLLYNTGQIKCSNCFCDTSDHHHCSEFSTGTAGRDGIDQ